MASASLADCTHPALLVTELRERDTAGIISQLTQVLHQQGCLPEVLPFYHAALNQELMASSATESGIAFPHARLSCITQLRFAFGRVAEPVVWGPKSSWPVQMVFLLAVPATDATQYLHLLACIAKLARNPQKLQALRTAETPATVWAILEQFKLREA